MKKRTRNLIHLGVFVLIILLVGLLIYLNLNFFNTTIRSYVEKFGYLGIFLFSFIADALVQPIGPEAPALIGVLFKLNFVGIIISTLLGSYLASLMIFYLGKTYLQSKFKFINKKRNYELFEKYGKWGLALAAISPVPWVVFCWLSGAYRLKLKQFIFYGLIPRTIRIIVIVGIAWYAGIFI
jgi:membrane protein YqaA with SNARE-associated domain